ncbi:MAG: hypothetical protein B7X54_01010 [Idiomarina sp. 34-48-12]|nr:MAG: hypothetical protein B7X54_01010 [Idiomarina sp. 34-48-12]
MHYVGMAAMQFNGILLYNVNWFLISIGVTIALGVIAMLTYRAMNQWSRDTEVKRILSRVISAALIAVAISGMHYTAMFAAVFGAEALLRWYHPEQGWISPAEFIPIAEDSGLIIEIGDWIIEQACEILRNWSLGVDTASLTLAINVSGRQFQQPDFVDKLCSAIQRYGINAQNLKLEITESLMLHDIEIVATKMHELTEVGVQFAIDDFGTGYSSLLYLAELPFETLKIDVQFVREMLHQKSTASIVQAIIQLAKSLNLSVIAEGVEEPEQRQFLMQLGCHTYQGYLFGRPVAVDEFNQTIRVIKTP